MEKSPMQTPKESIEHLPEFILFALARNPSADPSYRKAAVEHMIERGYKSVEHPDIEMLVIQVREGMEAKEEVKAIVESAIESAWEDIPRAGFTTQSMYKDESDD